MQNRSTCHRSVLLALCLSACAAADPVDGAPIGIGPVQSASGAALVGRYAMARGDVNTAATELLQASEGDPQNVELLRDSFSAALLAGRPEALALAARVPANPAALLLRADADIKAGDWQAAEAKFAKLPADGPNQILPTLLRAWAEQGSGASDEAASVLRPFIEGTRYRGIYALHGALISDLAGRTAEAGRLYRLAMVESGSLNLRLGTLVASWQARSGHPAEAHATLRATADATPVLAIAEPAMQQTVTGARVASATDGVAEAYLAFASVLQQQNAKDYALVLVHLALDLRPDFTPARLLMADLLSEQRRVDGAIAALAPVPPSDPLIAVVQLRLAQFAARQGNTAEAQRLFEQLAADHPQRPEPLGMLAEMQRDIGHFAESAGTFGRAIARVAQPSPRDWTLFYERGMVYDRAHDWQRAEPDFLHALELSPDQPAVLNYLGYAWTEQGRNLARARQMIERAVEQRPNDGSIVDSLGWVLLRSGDNTGAIRCLERAAELQPEDATINGHLGDAYEAVGRRREAEIQWRRALILNPEPQDAVRLQSKLAAPGAQPAPTAERHVD